MADESVTAGCSVAEIGSRGGLAEEAYNLQDTKPCSTPAEPGAEQGYDQLDTKCCSTLAEDVF